MKCHVFLRYTYINTMYDKFNDFNDTPRFVIIVLLDFSDIRCGRNTMLWLKGKKKADSECFLY